MHTMKRQDLEYLRSPPPNQPCPWCGGRTTHSQMCVELTDSWVRMRWGKHKGKPLREVPLDYIKFMVKNGFGTEEDQKMFCDHLHQLGQLGQPGRWKAMSSPE